MWRMPSSLFFMSAERHSIWRRSSERSTRWRVSYLDLRLRLDESREQLAQEIEDGALVSKHLHQVDQELSRVAIVRQLHRQERIGRDIKEDHKCASAGEVRSGRQGGRDLKSSWCGVVLLQEQIRENKILEAVD
jgi:hypothetical protein